MSCTDGSELMEGKIIFIGDNHIPSGRVHYSTAYLKNRKDLLEEEINRINKMKKIDSMDMEYLNELYTIKNNLN